MFDLTRRTFLKIGAAGFVLGSGLDRLAYALEKETNIYSFQKAIRPYTLIPSVCLQCRAGCGIVGVAVDDELIGILGNPRYPNNKGGICAKAAAGLNLVLDSERILFPLKRKGNRGDNQWERITWQKAIIEISSKLAGLDPKGSMPGFIVQIGVDDGYTPDRINLNRIGVTTLIDDIYVRDLNRIRAHELVWGEGPGIADVANSSYILNFGSNPYESHEHYIPFVQRLISARVNNKARLITFDVRLSKTAGRSDEWHPVRPGTDAAVVLAMCKIILEKDLADTSFLNNRTNMTKERLLSDLSFYSPQQAEQISGIKAEDITRIAVDFATFRPSVAFCGSGLTNRHGGIFNQIAILLLNAIVGNIDKKGGYCLPRRYSLEDPYTGSFIAGIDKVIDKEQRPAGLFMTYLSNSVYSDPAGSRITEILKDKNKLPFYVAVDTHITETSIFADIILPVATHFETSGLDSRAAIDMIPYIGLRQPVIKPRGGSVSFLNIIGMLGAQMAEKIDIDENRYIQAKLKKSKAVKNNGEFRRLRREGFWQDPDTSPYYKSYLGAGFKTQSGRMEFLSEEFKSKINSIYAKFKTGQNIGNLEKKELVLVTYSKNTASELNPNSKWLAEIFHENPLLINRKTAQKLGIKDNDRVEISSNGFKIAVFVRLTEAVHPEVAVIARGLGHWEFGHIAKGEKFSSIDSDTSLIWWKNNKSYHVNRLIRDTKDPVSGGGSLANNVVTLTKIG